MSCTAAAHDLMRASSVAFRASVSLTFRSWGVDEAGHDEEAQFGNCTRCCSTISIPVRMLAAVNPHERSARARKVGIILAQVPVGATRVELDALADCLVTFNQRQRDRFAEAAAANTPVSPATWAEVVAAARGRLTVDEVLARAMGAEGAVG